MANKALCLIPDCSNPVRYKNRGWCSAHYQRWSKHGNPTAGRVSNGSGLAEIDRIMEQASQAECWIWPYGKTTGGYGSLSINGVKTYAHRAVCERKYGPAPEKDLEAAHLCGKGHLGCVNPHHLAWKTKTENKADDLVHGVRARGERAGHAKLSESQVREIRHAYLNKQGSQSGLGKKYGVARSTIQGIVLRREWGWLPD